VSFRPGRDTGFAKWPALVRRDGRLLPRVIPGRLYMNKRGRWVLP
jgi:hypothetical protein